MAAISASILRAAWQDDPYIAQIEAIEAMDDPFLDPLLNHRPERMSRVASCLDGAHHLMLFEQEAMDVAEAQLRCIGGNGSRVCEEAALSGTDRTLYGPAVLDPYASRRLKARLPR